MRKGITTKPFGGAEYFLAFTDDKTLTMEEVYPLKQKSEVFSRFLESKAVVEKSCEYKFKSQITDNRGNFFSNKFLNTYLKSEGVNH